MAGAAGKVGSGMDRCAEAGCGNVWHGRRGVVRHVLFRSGQARQAGHGEERMGLVRSGEAGVALLGRVC
jgi:hypothetical protein